MHKVSYVHNQYTSIAYQIGIYTETPNYVLKTRIAGWIIRYLLNLEIPSFSERVSSRT